MSYIIDSCEFNENLPDEYVVLDIEATGNSSFNYIIEISAFKIKDDIVIDKFDKLVKPPEKLHDNGTKRLNSFILSDYDRIYYIDSFIENLTGIDNIMIDNADSEEEVIKEFDKFLDGNIVVGHGLSNDINLLNKTYKRVLEKNFKCSFVDTFELGLIVDNTEYSLINLCNRFDIENVDTHRASSDAYRTYLCYLKLKDIIVSDKSFSRKKHSKLIRDKIDIQKINSIRKKIKLFNKKNWYPEIDYLTSIGNLEEILYDSSLCFSPCLNLESKEKIKDMLAECETIFDEKIDEYTDYYITSLDIDYYTIEDYFDYRAMILGVGKYKTKIDEISPVDEFNSEEYYNSLSSYKKSAYRELDYIMENIINRDEDIKILSISQIENIYDLGFDPNVFFNEEYEKFIDFEENEFYIYNKLSTMTKSEAKELIKSKGGKVKNKFGEKTRYIIIGNTKNDFFESNLCLRLKLLTALGRNTTLLSENKFTKVFIKKSE